MLALELVPERSSTQTNHVLEQTIQNVYEGVQPILVTMFVTIGTINAPSLIPPC